MNKENILIYCSSRNNYEMLKGEIFENVDFEGFDFVNVDDNSSDEQITLGQNICKSIDIPFLKNKGRGLAAALQTIVDYAKNSEKKYKFIVWLTHDCYPITQNFFSKLSKLIEDKKLDRFGCVGFNTVWKKFICSESEFKKRNLEGRFCAVMGRAVLTPVPGAGWYRPSDFKMDWEQWGKNIAVDSIVDMLMMFNLEKYDSYIEFDENFHHFCWGDDICLQFLKNNVPNVTLSNFYVYHDQNLKIKYNIPTNSYRAAKSGNTYFFCSHDRHYARWEEKWGFERTWQTQLSKLPKEVSEIYEGNLCQEFINHDYKKGPLKYFDLGEEIE